MELAFQIGNAVINPPSGIPKGGLPKLEEFGRNFMMVFLFFGVCFVVIYITWGGIQWIMSGGEKQKLAAARAKISMAIIGFIMLLISYALVGAVGFFFNVNLLQF